MNKTKTNRKTEQPVAAMKPCEKLVEDCTNKLYSGLLNQFCANSLLVSWFLLSLMGKLIGQWCSKQFFFLLTFFFKLKKKKTSSEAYWCSPQMSQFLIWPHGKITPLLQHNCLDTLKVHSDVSVHAFIYKNWLKSYSVRLELHIKKKYLRRCIPPRMSCPSL